MTAPIVKTEKMAQIHGTTRHIACAGMPVAWTVETRPSSHMEKSFHAKSTRHGLDDEDMRIGMGTNESNEAV